MFWHTASVCHPVAFSERTGDLFFVCGVLFHNHLLAVDDVEAFDSFALAHTVTRVVDCV